MSSSQYAQDRFADLYCDASSRFFVEIGGYHPFVHSNSYWLETHRGWTGLVVEPDPKAAADIDSRRTAHVANVAVSSTAGTMEFVSAGPLSAVRSSLPPGHFDRIKSEFPDWELIEVDAVPFAELDALFPADRRIGYLSVDVEGHEPDVLESVDFDAYEIQCVTIEVDLDETGAIEAVLEANGFRRLFRYHTDAFYVLDRTHRGRSPFAKALLRLRMYGLFLTNTVRLASARLLR